MNAKHFYQIFIENFTPKNNPLVKEAFVPGGEDLNGTEWTSLMGKFLTGLMDGGGFKEEDSLPEAHIGKFSTKNGNSHFNPDFHQDFSTRDWKLLRTLS